jgi:magnesium-transporting ATPase (P-type)
MEVVAEPSATSTLGKQTMWAISGLLIIFAIVIQDPNVLKEILGPNVWLRWGVAIVAIVIVFGNFLYPRIQEITQTGIIKVDNGSISTFVVTVIGLIATIGFLYPDAIVQIMGNLGLEKYAASAVIILGIIYNAKYPNNVNNIVPVTSATTGKVDEGDVV